MFEGLIDWVTEVVETVGYGGVAFLVALESVFPPIPSEVVLPLAGFVAGRGDASFPGMVLAATLGSVVGSWILYGASWAVGPVRLESIVVRHGRWLGVKEGDLERAEAWFDRRGDAAVLLGRCVPLIRSLVSVPAGFRRMRVARFTALTALGSLMWNLALIGAGVALGDRWQEAGDLIGVVQTGVVIVIVVGLGYWVWTRFLAPRLADRGLAPPPDDEIDHHLTDAGDPPGDDRPA